jgi:hypothetical protein
MPRRFRVQFYWIFYAFGVLIYIWGLSLLERKLFFIKGGVPFGIVIAAVIFVALWTYQNRYVVRRVRIVYEDEPEKILTTLE